MKEQLDLWDKVVSFISPDGTVEEVLGSQCFSHICKDDNPRKRAMPWTGGNKRAEKHSSLSQSVKGQVLAVPMPSKPPENARCGQEALLDISISSITRQYVENQLHYRQQVVSLSNPFRLLCFFSQCCNLLMWQIAVIPDQGTFMWKWRFKDCLNGSVK